VCERERKKEREREREGERKKERVCVREREIFRQIRGEYIGKVSLISCCDFVGGREIKRKGEKEKKKGGKKTEGGRKGKRELIC
jgi:hypothetical protein